MPLSWGFSSLMILMIVLSLCLIYAINMNLFTIKVKSQLMESSALLWSW